MEPENGSEQSGVKEAWDAIEAMIHRIVDKSVAELREEINLLKSRIEQLEGHV